MMVGDIHGDMQDASAVQAMFEFRDIWNPEIRIHVGDNWDFRPLRIKASEDEKREKMEQDFDAGMEFLVNYQPTHFLRGNHDERLWDLASANRGILSEYAVSLTETIEKCLRTIKCPMLPYDKRDGVLEIGKLRAIHGYACGVNAARRSALAYGTVYLGHVHTDQEATVEGIDRRIGRSIGCLCKLNMPYSRATMASLSHSHGFAYGVINKKTGEFAGWQARNINGIWVMPQDIVVIKSQDRS